MWNLPPQEVENWDYMTSQMIGIANTVGVMATNGMRYYERMKKADDGVHLAQEMPTIDVIVEMLCDGVNAMYAAKPAGSFATLQKLAAVADSSASAGISAAAQAVVA